MSKFFSVPKYLQKNRFLRYFMTYSFVFIVICWANYIFYNYRIVGNILFSLMPIVGIITMYLWIILLADEFLALLKSYGPIAAIIKKIKLVSFVIIALYGVMALGLWINRLSNDPLITKPAKIITKSNIDMGALNYRLITVSSWDTNKGTKKILITDNDAAGLYVGDDIEILIRKGTLYLYRVLEINRDMEKYYFKMLKVAPDSTVAMRGLVNIYMSRNQFEKALKWHDKLVEKLPDESDVGIELGKMLIEDRRFDQAANVFRKILNTKRDYEVLYLLGYTLAWSGKKYEAEKYLREAIELDPTDFRALYSLGYVYRDTGRYKEAKEAWERVLELIPNFPEVKDNIKSIENKI